MTWKSGRSRRGRVELTVDHSVLLLAWPRREILLEMFYLVIPEKAFRPLV